MGDSTDTGSPQLLRSIRRALRTAPTAALVVGIACPAALADPGDFDPGFADVGRFVGADFTGNARAIETQDDDFIFAGGDVYYAYYYEDLEYGFAGRLAPDGTLDTTFDAPELADAFVIDSAVRGDGKIVGIALRDYVYFAFQLEPDGALDVAFGVMGIRELSDVDGLGSLAIDPAGTIAIAGRRANDIKVMRLLENGDLDPTFGTSGIFTAEADSAREAVVTLPRIVSIPGGGYRVTDNDFSPSAGSRCRVLAVTADGAVDISFGDEGHSGIALSDGPVLCYSLADLSDGKLLVGGAADSEPLLVRLVASGAADPAFAGGEIAGSVLREVAAFDVDAATGSIAVTGPGPDNTAGFPVVRLQSDGTLDTQFGVNGTAWVDLPVTQQLRPLPTEVNVLANGDVLLAGGAALDYYDSKPFVARLLGDAEIDGPGVLGVTYLAVDATESAQAVVTVRRIGGSTGGISVAYAARAASADVFSATEGQDFAAANGELSWADGDATDRQIFIDIEPHEGAPEESETFVVELSDVQGGGGLGTAVTSVSIQSDAPAAGMFALEFGDLVIGEESQFVSTYVSRRYSWEGEVAVTVRMTADTATEDDYGAEPITVTWADGDGDWKQVDVPIVNDDDDESDEGFSLQLADAAGGAVIGPRNTASVSIIDNDPVPGGGGGGGDGGGGGGGRAGWVSLLLLALTRWLRVRGPA
jgi:uncharacterized delta-60 repeat protein